MSALGYSEGSIDIIAKITKMDENNGFNRKGT